MMYQTSDNSKLLRRVPWGPSIKDVGIFLGGEGGSNSDVARY